MPASSYLLIVIGILGVCTFVVHLLIRQQLHREARNYRTRNRLPLGRRTEEWLEPTRPHTLTSASV
jgi:hypothetical protein